MKRYKLKPEAVGFFDSKYSTQTLTLKEWEDLKVSIKALDEVRGLYITYGHKKIKGTTDLSEWNMESDDSPENAKFYFTINFSGMTYDEFYRFRKLNHPALLMNRIQREADKVFDEFLRV